MYGLKGRPGRQWVPRFGLRLLRTVFAFMIFILVTGVAVLSKQTSAWATEITQPSASPFVIPLDSHLAALPFTVSSTGWPSHQLVYIEICDGEPTTRPGWSPASHCDNQTSPSPAAADSHGNVTFPAGSQNFSIIDFHGASPNGQFNCVAPSELPGDSAVGPDGSRTLSPRDTQAADGVALNPDTPAWTQCQLRVSSNNSYSTTDQRFMTLLIPTLGGAGASGPVPPSGASRASGATTSAAGPAASHDAARSTGTSALAPGAAGSALAGTDPSHLASTGIDPRGLVVLGFALISVGGVFVIRARYGTEDRLNVS